jgi:hypothetical protein
MRISNPGERFYPHFMQEQKNLKRLRPFLHFILMSFVAVTPAFAAPSPAAAQTQKNLYQRLGGYDALAAVTDDFIGHLATDPQLGRFFVGLSTDSKIRVRQHSCGSLPAGPASTPDQT